MFLTLFTVIPLCNQTELKFFSRVCNQTQRIPQIPNTPNLSFICHLVCPLTYITYIFYIKYRYEYMSFNTCWGRFIEAN